MQQSQNLADGKSDNLSLTEEKSPVKSLGFYEHVMDPFQHQMDYLEDYTFKQAFALFWEMGTAKSKAVIDNAAILYLSEEINSMLIVAPPGVDHNWVINELPKHLPDVVKYETAIMLWRTAQQNTLKQKNRLRTLMEYQGFKVLVISYHAFMTNNGKKIVWEFLKNAKQKVLYILDEAHYIKSPNAKRTKSIVASGKYARYRRILTGTPISTGPFDLYSPIRFLAENFWKEKGIAGSTEYKNYFGEWFTRQDCMMQRGYDPKFNQLLGYKNINELKEWIAPISSRVTKDEVLDLPPKLYSRVYVEITPEQRKIYEQLKNEYMVEFADGNVINGALAITRLLRFQQILCNYVPIEGGEPIKIVEGDNPRLKALEEIVEQIYHPGIIFARFTNDVSQIMELFSDKEAVRYDGTLSYERANHNRIQFEKGRVQWIVSTISKGAEGLQWHRAKTVIYYSNTFDMTRRKQSEDRAHRSGMDDNPVNYIDITTRETIDEDIVASLQGKHEIATEVLGDELKKWLLR